MVEITKLIFFLIVLISYASSQLCDTDVPYRSRIATSASNILRSKNFGVDTRGIQYFDRNASAFGANPSSPYGVYSFFPYLRLAVPWQMYKNDAVVWFGCTPPKAAYFSWRSYDFSSPYPTPQILFASMGDSTNQLVFNSTGIQSGDPFGKTSVVITTADITTAAAIASAFSAAGFSDSFINIDIVTSSLVNMGRDIYDRFTVLMRVAEISDPQAREEYLKSEFPVFYVTAPLFQQLNPFPVPSLRPRGTGKGEQYLQDSLNTLINDVTNYYSQHMQFISKYDLIVSTIDGFNCIKERTNCAGDNRDTLYFTTGRDQSYFNVTFSATDFFVMVGVNHASAKNLAYSNFALYSIGANGIPTATTIAVVNSQYQGSATMYNPSLPNVELLYTYSFARDCGDTKFCVSVNSTEIEEGERFAVAERTYLEIATKTGPLDTEIIVSSLLHFKMQ